MAFGKVKTGYSLPWVALYSATGTTAEKVLRGAADHGAGGRKQHGCGTERSSGAVPAHRAP